MATTLTPQQIIANRLTAILGDAEVAIAIATRAWADIKAAGGSANPDQAWGQVEGKITGYQEFKNRFPAFEWLMKQGQMTDISQALGAIRSYEATAKNLLRPIGADADYTRQEIQQWMMANVSPDELGRRVGLAVEASAAPSEATSALKQQYGLDDAMLARFWLDPAKTEVKIRQMWTAGQIGGAAQRTGFGPLTVTEAEVLSQQTTADAAQRVFEGIASQQDLFAQQVGDVSAVDRKTQLGLVAGEMTAQDYIRRRQSQRRAEFQGTSGFATTQRGVAGLGSDNSS